MASVSNWRRFKEIYNGRRDIEIQFISFFRFRNVRCPSFLIVNCVKNEYVKVLEFLFQVSPKIIIRVHILLWKRT